MLRAAVRLGVGTATLLGGGWFLRALHGAPAALGAGPLDIHAVAHDSPNHRDGAFANVDPASKLEIIVRTSETCWARCFAAGRAGRPATFRW